MVEFEKIDNEDQVEVFLVVFPWNIMAIEAQSKVEIQV